jgi:hypothetical protein
VRSEKPRAYRMPTNRHGPWRWKKVGAENHYGEVAD